MRRQWLGIDPPGPLFRNAVDGVPFYHALRAALVADADRAKRRRLFAMLLREDYVPVRVDLMLSRMDHVGASLDGPPHLKRHPQTTLRAVAIVDATPLRPQAAS